MIKQYTMLQLRNAQKNEKLNLPSPHGAKFQLQYII